MSEQFESAVPYELDEPTSDAPAEPRKPWPLILQVLLLDNTAFADVRDDRKPWKRGLGALLLVLFVVAAARLIGLGLGWLTSPNLDSLQTHLRDRLTSLPWYTQQVAASPDFAVNFQLAYAAVGDALRALFGLPAPSTTGLSILGQLLSTLAAWLVYGLLAHWIARWFHGQARWRQSLGVLALAYAPLLWTVVELVPGADVPLSLLFGLLLVAKYQAIKTAHGLGVGYSLAAMLGPYLVGSVLLIGLAFFGSAWGVMQIPYFDELLRWLPISEFY